MINYRDIDAENFPATEWLSSSGILTTTPLPYCGECAEGWAYVESDEAGTARTAIRCPVCYPLRRKLKNLELARLPYTAHQHTLSAYEWDSEHQAERIGAVLDWLHDKTNPIDKPCVLLVGTPGNGKSTILHILAKHAVFQGKRALFITHEGHLMDIKSSFNSTKRLSLHELLEGVDLLCLDEIGGMGGGGNWTAWSKAQTLEIISAIHDRWASKALSVVATSNLRPSQILDDLCERNTAAASRLAEMFGKPVKMIGKDRRKRIDDGWRD